MKKKAERTVYDVVQKTFGNLPNWKPGEFRDRVIATCKSRALAQGIIARNNTSFHSFEILERAARG